MATEATANSDEPWLPGGVVATAAHAAQILIVEDEHLVALDIQRGVQRMGHIATVVYSGEAAVKQANATRFDLVLMDIKLGGELDGIETARTLRSLCDIPVIYLTAYADNPTLDRARATEPYGYVLKPFQERELKAAIDMALKRHSSDRSRQEQERIQRFLADASSRMAASLDYRAVVTGASELLIPQYADWCTLVVNESDDAMPAFSHTRPDGHAERAPGGTRAHLIEEVLRTGRPVLCHISQASALRHALGSTHFETLVELGARSAICVPLRARGITHGALAMAVGASRPRYIAEDLFVAEDFGHRLAMALDNALLYRKAERAVQMRDDVLAIVSHDLRTPLGTILLQAELLAGSRELGAAGEQIARSARLMNRLIGDLLDATAINAGKLALDCHVHRAHCLVDEAVEMFRSQADARGVSLVEDSPDMTLEVSCDADRIVQVLANLISNAIKFTPRDGVVTVSAKRVGDGIELAVVDTGRGIPAEQVPFLFDRFWRAKAQRHGAGLGLFIARGIVASHGSSLELQTELDKGSRFWFILPDARQ